MLRIAQTREELEAEEKERQEGRDKESSSSRRPSSARQQQSSYEQSSSKLLRQDSTSSSSATPSVPSDSTDPHEQTTSTSPTKALRISGGIQALMSKLNLVKTDSSARDGSKDINKICPFDIDLYCNSNTGQYSALSLLTLEPRVIVHKLVVF